MVKARKIVIASLFKGEPKVTDFKIETEELPTLQDGQILVKAEYISVDPYQRAFTERHAVGGIMIGSQVGRIVESRASEYPVGRYVIGYWGWRDRTVVSVESESNIFLPPRLVSDMGELPLSLSLGVVGMTGATAYFGLLDICDPKPGETVVVNSAAGAVGSVVGQIARIKGCKVIGITGSDVKVKWLKEELGFDHALNYKSVNVDKALKEAAPGGIHVYFDNVGGDQSHQVLQNMRHRGRISVCGSISTYNDTRQSLSPVIQWLIVRKELKIEGFLVSRWWDQVEPALVQLAQWVRQGKLKYGETLTEGFENTPQAFIGMLRGENMGKAVVKV